MPVSCRILPFHLLALRLHRGVFALLTAYVFAYYSARSMENGIRCLNFCNRQIYKQPSVKVCEARQTQWHCLVKGSLGLEQAR